MHIAFCLTLFVRSQSLNWAHAQGEEKIGCHLLKRHILRVPLWLNGLRTWHCHCCGSGSIPGPGPSIHRQCSQKKKRKENILKTLWMYVPSNRNCWSSRWATIPIACVLCSARLRVWSLARAQQMKGSSVAIAVAWVTHGTWIWSLAQERHCHRWPKLKKQNKTKQAENLANVYEKQVYGKMEMFVNIEKEVIWNNIFF